VNYDILSYLPDDLPSVQGERVLDETFHTAGISVVILEDGAPREAAALTERVAAVHGVGNVIWIDSITDLSVPADILPSDAVPAVEEILEKLRRGKTPDPQSARDEILHTVACKAAIKAGWDTSRAELERIVQEVLSGRVRYCPHGRPVSSILTKKDLEKMFKRIV
jgi:DNA mismatch repair protein MutL